ncbi:CrcB-like protein-domain-containing protein [Annulohypoxylon maeteangense]|uniref:CrcB-like protein-domain-containing protein n=1 Tax=Annulohypoxylon maeteangense TaxID=1927788 RepID=UPI00200726E9|nr:CrcB-like protein-domain-containing protein [Annulohypoxylon maeteangense]KAI0880783.1 CrcB-like protein-domain-containing protein [Annulohypoxylon maeteangense]
MEDNQSDNPSQLNIERDAVRHDGVLSTSRNYQSGAEYDAPESYKNLHDVDENGDRLDPDVPHTAEELKQLETRRQRRRSSVSQSNYDIPDSYANVPELEEIAPIPSRDERRWRPSPSLEEGRELERRYTIQQEARRHSGEEPQKAEEGGHHVSRLATEIYTISYLILFAIFGTLARVGLQALTNYVGAPVTFSSLWPNFAGSMVLGFLAEDRMLFRFEWGTPTYELQLLRAKESELNEETGESSSGRVTIDLAAAKKAHMATKKTIPLYIGLATGFCGSFTSFSSFIRDIFLALSNDLLTPGTGPVTIPRNGGYSFMALVAVAITTITLSIAGLLIGAQLALALEPITPSLPFNFTRKFIDPFAVFLAWGSWIGAILLSILPPDRFVNEGASEIWRGRATFALVFAPLGCLGRFYASLYLNGYLPSFPLGTFTVNILGTMVLGMAWDLAHVPVGGVISCQVFQGIEDGFCGCLTTVSTWVAELTALSRRHSYMYGGTSVLVALACMVAIMGGLRWSDGFSSLKCLH